MSAQVKTYNSAAAAAEACGAAIFELLDGARSARGIATLAVSGGTTPRIMFEWMARQAFDWKGVEIFQVDERCVPIDDSQSNYRMMRESLPAGLPIHRVRTELAPDQAALAYEDEIRGIFKLSAGELPAFDIVQRGMGPDMHTASLFPGEPMIENRTGIAAAVWVEKFKQHRVTLLPGLLEKARTTLCLVTGADKAPGLKQVLQGERDPLHVPSQISSAEMIWIVDEAAGAQL